MRYPKERREAVLKKMLPPNNRTISELAKEEGKYSSNPPLQPLLKIVRDTGAVILYKAGHGKLAPTPSQRPRSSSS